MNHLNEMYKRRENVSLIIQNVSFSFVNVSVFFYHGGVTMSTVSFFRTLVFGLVSF